MEIIVSNKKKLKASVMSPGAEKQGIYPFVTQNLTGDPLLVKSHKHRKILMKEHNVHDDKVSTPLQTQKRRLYTEGKKEEGREKIREIFLKCKHGKIDTRPADIRQRKAEYERRNHGM